MASGRRLTEKLCFIFLAVSAMLCPGRTLRMAAPPLKPNRPFAFMWNAPTELCKSRFGLLLDLSLFDYVTSTLKSATNQFISIFYTDRFGIFPYIDEDTGEMYDEGLPQLINMTEHRELAEDDIEHYIPVDQLGLAVLDFEDWRPQWSRNWGSKDIYRQKSIDHIKNKNSSLSDDEVEARAKISFERGAKRYFMKSIRLGKRLRPKRLWGYYLYPDCYNYDYNQDMVGFTGKCPDLEEKRNDELLWLWEESDALYPSIYLELALKDSLQARLFVRHRMHEAMRVSMLSKRSYAIPVYPYIRPVYKDSVDKYMSEFDLVNTIGEAAALGAAGIISWGDMDVTNDEDSCLDARRHLEAVMNPYILNVSKAAQLCSVALCQGRGRCVRKRWDDNVYLHLDARHYRIEASRRGGPLVVRGGGLSQADVYQFDRNFDCMCFSAQPCHSLLTLNFIPDFIATDGPNGGGCSHTRPRPLLLWAALLALRYTVM
ncbi:hyaluronidase-5-like [Genypterus blacodes]|uniref:hyaluronidase-5-like n=1 Tax=Genypterus blacodes TaxID=154954 RepID=UPI003F768800